MELSASPVGEEGETTDQRNLRSWRVPNVPPSCEGAGEGIGEEGSVAAEEACGCTDLESSGQRLQQRRRAGSLSSHSSLSSVGQQQDHNSSNCSTPRQRPKRRGARRRAHVAASAAAVTANAAAVVRASRDAQQGAGTGESFRDLWSQLDQQLDELMSIIYEEVECQRAVTVAEYFAEKCVREGNSLVDLVHKIQVQDRFDPSNPPKAVSWAERMTSPSRSHAPLSAPATDTCAQTLSRESLDRLSSPTVSSSRKVSTRLEASKGEVVQGVKSASGRGKGSSGGPKQPPRRAWQEQTISQDESAAPQVHSPELHSVPSVPEVHAHGGRVNTPSRLPRPASRGSVAGPMKIPKPAHSQPTVAASSEGTSQVDVDDAQECADIEAMMLEEFGGSSNRIRSWASPSPPQSPPSIRKIQERLASPERSRKSPEIIEQHLAEKMRKADENRSRLEAEKRSKLEEESEKLEVARLKRERQVRKTRASVDDRMQRAAYNREDFVQQIAEKASMENTKVTEINFIQSVNEEIRRAELKQNISEDLRKKDERRKQQLDRRINWRSEGERSRSSSPQQPPQSQQSLGQSTSMSGSSAVPVASTVAAGANVPHETHGSASSSDPVNATGPGDAQVLKKRMARKAKKLRQRIALYSREYLELEYQTEQHFREQAASLEAAGKEGRGAPINPRIKRLLGEIQGMVSARCLPELRSLLTDLLKYIDEKREAELHYIRYVSGIELIFQTISQVTNTTPPLVVKLLAQVLSVVVSLKENACYVVHSGKITQLLSWMMGVLRKESRDEDFLPQILTTITRCFQRGLPKPSWTPSIERLKADFVGLLLNSGLREVVQKRISDLSSLDPTSINTQVTMRLLAFFDSMLFLPVTCPWDRPVYEPVESQEVMRDVMEASEIVFNGVVQMLVHIVPRLFSSKSKGVSPATVSMLCTCVRIFNNIGRMDVHTLQHWALETLFHEFSQLFFSLLTFTCSQMETDVPQVNASSSEGTQVLSGSVTSTPQPSASSSSDGSGAFCAEDSSSRVPDLRDLHHELILLGGYLCLSNVQGQELLRMGKPPNLLSRLCQLPIGYFTDMRLKCILFPTLIAACHGNEDNKLIVQQDLSMDMLRTFVEQHIHATKQLQGGTGGDSSTSDLVTVPRRFWLQNRVPSSQVPPRKSATHTTSPRSTKSFSSASSAGKPQTSPHPSSSTSSSSTTSSTVSSSRRRLSTSTPPTTLLPSSAPHPHR